MSDKYRVKGHVYMEFSGDDCYYDEEIETDTGQPPNDMEVLHWLFPDMSIFVDSVEEIEEDEDEEDDE